MSLSLENGCGALQAHRVLEILSINLQKLYIVEVPNRHVISCLDSSLGRVPPVRQATRVRSPAEANLMFVSRVLSLRLKMTQIKSLYNIILCSRKYHFGAGSDVRKRTEQFLLR
jgi:hypothetical protein